jgi:NIPSNAP
MIIDLRTYTYLPSKYRKFLKSYEEIGFALTSKHLGKTLGIFRPESGIQNRTFQFFLYENSEHRDIQRRGLLADPAWGEFVKIDSDALLQQMNMLLAPTSFSVLQRPADFDPLPVDVTTTRLFELHSWTCQPARWHEVIKEMANGGSATLARHSPDTIGWFHALTGTGYRLFQLSAFADATARDNALVGARTDKDVQAMQAFLRSASSEEETQLLLPLPYSPLR